MPNAIHPPTDTLHRREDSLVRPGLAKRRGLRFRALWSSGVRLVWSAVRSTVRIGDPVVADPALRTGPRSAKSTSSNGAVAPSADGQPRGAQLLRECSVVPPVRREQHEARPPRRPVRQIAVTRPLQRIIFLSIAWNNRNCRTARPNRNGLQERSPSRKNSPSRGKRHVSRSPAPARPGSGWGMGAALGGR